MNAVRGVISINLEALQHNYKLLQKKAGDHVCVAGVVKANAYGLGADDVSRALIQCGCDKFFVANLTEALALRAISDDIAIYVLNGFHEADGMQYIDHNIIPVIDDLSVLAAYQALAMNREMTLTVGIHVNTGMMRLGMDADDVLQIAKSPALLSGLDLNLVISHLACADDKDHDLNAKQLERFKSVRAAFPDCAAALANSSGIFLGNDYHFDMVRPGMAVYGLNPTPYAIENPMKRVIDVHIPMVGHHGMQAGDTLGYGATFTADKKTQVAVLGAGYADGIFRSLSNKGAFYYQGQKCPIIGRVSMDLTCVDISGLTDADGLPLGALFEYIGPHQSPAVIGADAGSFDYEVITVLSQRFERIYHS